MHFYHLSFSETGFHSPLMRAYVKGDLPVDFYTNQPSFASFGSQRLLKSKSYPYSHRKVLKEALVEQYSSHGLMDKRVDANIQRIDHENTFTVCTGHQLNIFTGPLFFVYKVLHTINLSQLLSKQFPDMYCVPVYWMASEDHDYEEINHIHLGQVKLNWNTEQRGAVGTFSTEGLQEVISTIEDLLPDTPEAKTIIDLFRESYQSSQKLASAMFKLVHELFKQYGLVVIDPNQKALKELFKPVMRRELEESFAKPLVDKTSEHLAALGFSAQVNAREINLFYLEEGSRKRIVRRKKGFGLSDSKTEFSEEQLLDTLENAPERFSPNVVLRPLYQETILPNLAYIGGGGELAYSMQLKAVFESASTPFPLFVLRNSVFWMSAKEYRKMGALQAEFKDFIRSKDAFVNSVIRRISDLSIDFSPQRELLKEQFLVLKEMAKKTDKSFIGAVSAQEHKQIKGLDHLEKRLLKAQKRKLQDEVKRLVQLYDRLYPMGTPHERFENLSVLYAKLGPTLFDALLEAFGDEASHGKLHLIVSENL